MISFPEFGLCVRQARARGVSTRGCGLGCCGPHASRAWRCGSGGGRSFCRPVGQAGVGEVGCYRQRPILTSRATEVALWRTLSRPGSAKDVCCCVSFHSPACAYPRGRDAGILDVTIPCDRARTKSTFWESATSRATRWLPRSAAGYNG